MKRAFPALVIMILAISCVISAEKINLLESEVSLLNTKIEVMDNTLDTKADKEEIEPILELIETTNLRIDETETQVKAWDDWVEGVFRDVNRSYQKRTVP
jgi:outer membrane murein-binding lipoprotein Lpp